VPPFHGDESLLQLEPELMEKVRRLGDLASPSAMTIARSELDGAVGLAPGSRGCQVPRNTVCFLRYFLDGAEP